MGNSAGIRLGSLFLDRNRKRFFALADREDDPPATRETHLNHDTVANKMRRN